VVHFVDNFCGLQNGDLDKETSSELAADTFFDRWISVFGPPKEAVVDEGNEFYGKFESTCKWFSIMVQPLPLSAKWKNGTTERHEAVAKLMLIKVIMELSLTTKEDLRYAVAMVFLGREPHVSKVWVVAAASCPRSR